MNKGQFCCTVSNSWHIHETYNNNVRCQYNDNCCLCGMYRLPPVDGMLVHRSLPLLTGTLPSISFKKTVKPWLLAAPSGPPYKNLKRRGCSSEILKRTPKRYQESKILFWVGVVEIFFPPTIGTNSYITHNLLSYWGFRLITVKVTVKSPAGDLLRQNTRF